MAGPLAEIDGMTSELHRALIEATLCRTRLCISIDVELRIALRDGSVVRPTMDAIDSLTGEP